VRQLSILADSAAPEFQNASQQSKCHKTSESELFGSVKPGPFEATFKYVSAARRANLVADYCPGGAQLRVMMACAQLQNEGVTLFAMPKRSRRFDMCMEGRS
jgi:hypothetical protein